MLAADQIAQSAEHERAERPQQNPAANAKQYEMNRWFH